MTEANTLDALIVRHVADLEAAQRRLEKEIDPRLLREASAAMERRADLLGWVHDFLKDAGVISVAPEEWIKRNQNGEIGSWLMWFELSTTDAGGELDQAWHLSEFLEAEGGASRKALSFHQEVLRRAEWRAVLSRSRNEVKALRDLGFDIDKGSIKLPVRLDSAVLQRGFEEDDLDDALVPVGAALDLAVQAMPYFQVLAEAILAGSKD